MREFKDSLTGKSKDDDEDEPRSDQRAQVAKALGRPEGEESPLEGEVVSDRK
jgi:hypothetical protein